jgi:hypothetical protein
MKNKANLPPKARKMLQEARRQAHKRVIKRGLIQFRVEEELLDHLLQIADHKKMPVSVLVRSWVAEHVREELPNTPVQDIVLPDGTILAWDSYQQDLEQAYRAYKQRKLRLNARQVHALTDWLHQYERPKRRKVS